MAERAVTDHDQWLTLVYARGRDPRRVWPLDICRSGVCPRPPQPGRWWRWSRRRQLVAVLAVAALLVSFPTLASASVKLATMVIRPTPGVGEHAAPLGRPPPLTQRSKSYVFIVTQPHSSDPVTWDPCRVITYVTSGNPPVGGKALLVSALAVITGATGLQFRDGGTTTETPSESRHEYQPLRYGDRWAPMLVAWSSPDASPRLVGDVTGFASASRVKDDAGHMTYVTGQVVLDGPELGSYRAAGAVGVARIIIVHELGHVVGLGHVDDVGQAMRPHLGPENVFLGPGDRTGLAALGAGACAPSL